MSAQKVQAALSSTLHIDTRFIIMVDLQPTETPTMQPVFAPTQATRRRLQEEGMFAISIQYFISIPTSDLVPSNISLAYLNFTARILQTCVGGNSTFARALNELGDPFYNISVPDSTPPTIGGYTLTELHTPEPSVFPTIAQSLSIPTGEPSEMPLTAPFSAPQSVFPTSALVCHTIIVI